MVISILVDDVIVSCPLICLYPFVTLTGGRLGGGLFAGATAGNGVGASASLSGALDGAGAGVGGAHAESHAGGFSKSVVKLSELVPPPPPPPGTLDTRIDNQNDLSRNEVSTLLTNVHPPTKKYNTHVTLNYDTNCPRYPIIL